MIGTGRGSLPGAGGVAALIAGATLLVGIAGFATRSSGLRPWLAVLFGINAGSGAVSRDSLRAVKPIDILLLCLAGLTFIGFWPGPGTRQAPWMVLAIALPLAGIAILLATRLAGRSGLMGGALVLSILMLVGDSWTPVGTWGSLQACCSWWATSAQQDVAPGSWRPSSRSATHR